MTIRAPALGWGVLLGAALAAALGPLMVQLLFAVVAIGVLGMAHGASDLAILAPRQRMGFLAAYGATSVACLIWWVAYPAVALPVFLIASALHFGMEDAPNGSVVERIARGAGLVVIPAALHRTALQSLLHYAGGAEVPVVLTAALAAAGALCAIGLLATAVVRRDARLLTGTAALLLLPPLVGFAVGFLVLHALPQTSERQRRLGCATIGAYLRATAPILVAALLLVVVVALVVLRHDPSGVRALFAGIAALAMPHLLVTPLFEPARDVEHGREAVGRRAARI
ncbi:Brp/Blh family beta-carotene 15,15'-dioxygenase [Sphingomonas sp. BAUL-RG-20F-R05-02]|uniref:Brp/Blh family beta-carotene 15,15'-dioxygenase n=1 Tax=Sphingomonas sp. BAUL-RG-20F-R05-02 TaxID=2914830 RepID=UPI001F58AB78|nr:Brp/Blh family beta-carotene 15,15'-dioxygenase [Sphingomonas sp. BAUL-RG-20F-R05-02]